MKTIAHLLSILILSVITLKHNLNAQVPDQSPWEGSSSGVSESGGADGGVENYKVGVQSTGQFGLTIPLGKVETRGTLAFNLALTYSPDVRVAEEGGFVGAGWDFPIGKIVRRNILRADYLLNSEYPVPPVVCGSGDADNYRDVYEVSFPGGSGRMIQVPRSDTQLESDTTSYIFILENYKPWNIKYDNVYERFIITIENGTTYVFGALDKSAQMIGIIANQSRCDNEFTNSGELPTLREGYALSTEPRIYNPYQEWNLSAILSADYIDGGGDPYDPLDDSSQGKQNKGDWVSFSYQFDGDLTDKKRTIRSVGSTLGDSKVVYASVKEVTYLKSIQTPVMKVVVDTEDEDKNILLETTFSLNDCKATTWLKEQQHLREFLDPAAWEQEMAIKRRLKRLKKLSFFSNNGNSLIVPESKSIHFSYLTTTRVYSIITQKSFLKSVSEVVGTQTSSYDLNYYDYSDIFASGELNLTILPEFVAYFGSSQGGSGSRSARMRVDEYGFYARRYDGSIGRQVPDAMDAKLYQLKNIRYPSGVLQEFDYELNLVIENIIPGASYSNISSFQNGPRLKSQTLRFDATNTVEYTYSYKRLDDPQKEGASRLVIEPIYLAFHLGLGTLGQSIMVGQQQLTPTYVYKAISETCNDNSKTIYEYNYPLEYTFDTFKQSFTSGFPPIEAGNYQLTPRLNALIEKTIAASGDLKRLTKLTPTGQKLYERNNSVRVFLPAEFAPGYQGVSVLHGQNVPLAFSYYLSYLRVEENFYDPLTEIYAQTITDTYYSGINQQPHTIIKNTFGGDQIRTYLKYGFEVYPKMKTDNLYSQVAQVTKYNNGTLSSSDVVTYTDLFDYDQDGYPSKGKWRAHRKFIYNGVSSSDFSHPEFPYWGTDNSPGGMVPPAYTPAESWNKSHEVRHVNESGNLLAASDGQNNFAYQYSENIEQYVYGYNNSRMIAKITNGARKPEENYVIGSNYAFTGFEVGSPVLSESFPDNRFDDWEIYPATNYISNISHSGYTSCKINSGSTVFGPTIDINPKTMDDQKRIYRFSAWVKTEITAPDNSAVLVIHSKRSGGDNSVYPTTVPTALAYRTVTSGTTKGKWIYLSVDIDLESIRSTGQIPESERLVLRAYVYNTNTTGTLLVDDIAIRPADATMETFSYDIVNDQVISLSDQNNFYTQRIFHAAGNNHQTLNNDYLVVSEVNEVLPDVGGIYSILSEMTYPNGNMVSNGGFERGGSPLDEWFAGNTIQLDFSSGFTGKNALKMTALSTDSYAHKKLTDGIRFEKNKKYTVSFRAKTPYTDGTVVNVEAFLMSLITSPFQYLTFQNGSVNVTGNQWTYYKIVIQIDGNSAWDNLVADHVIRLDVNTNSKEVLIDNLVVSEYSDSPDVLISKKYLNTMGNPIQETVIGREKQIINRYEYNNFGSPTKAWKPYEVNTSNGEFDNDYSTNCASYYGVTPNDPNAPLFSETLYYTDGTQRVLSTRPAGVPESHKTLYQYSIVEEGDVYLQLKTSTDADGLVSKVYKNGRNQVLKTVLAAGTTNEKIVQYKYTADGKTVEITHPDGQKSNYLYDLAGSLIKAETPYTNAPFTSGSESDVSLNPDIIRYYNRSATLRAARMPVNIDKVLYYKYDRFQQLIETGLANASSVSSVSSLGWPTTSDGAIANQIIDYGQTGLVDGFNLSNTIGRVSRRTEKLSAGSGIGSNSKITYFSYNQYGSPSSVWQKVNNLKVTEKYDYTKNNLITKIRYELNDTPVLIQWTDYDEYGRISRVYCSEVDSKPGLPVKTFTYNAEGSVVESKEGETTQLTKQFTFNLDGSVNELIAKNSSGADIFRQRLYYSTGLPAGASSYRNGRVSFMDERISTPTGLTNRFSFSYEYDALGQLLASNSYKWDPVTSSLIKDTSNPYNTAYSYDLMGNALTVTRRNQQLIDNLAYQYSANRLQSVADLSSNPDGYSSGGLLTYSENYDTVPVNSALTTLGYTVNTIANCGFTVSTSGNTTSRKARIAVATSTGNTPGQVAEIVGPIQKANPAFKYKYTADTWCTGYEAAVGVQFLNASKTVISTSVVTFTKYSFGNKTQTVTAPANTRYVRLVLRMKNEGFPTEATFDNIKIEPVYSQVYTTAFDYDGFGNTIRDLNNGITSVLYNHQNLPVKITKGDNSVVEYAYDADGNRLLKKTGATLTNYYVRSSSGAIIAELVNPVVAPVKTTGNQTVSFNGTAPLSGTLYLYYINYPSGGRRVIKSGGTVQQYFVSDHKGSNRLLLESTVSSAAIIVSSEVFYPYGGTLVSWVSGVSEDAKFKFQGNERDAETGYDNFNARYYDPFLIRFLQTDPKMYDFPEFNPYVAMANDPVSMIDPGGDATFRNVQTGQLGWMDDAAAAGITSFVDDMGHTWVRVEEFEVTIPDFIFIRKDQSDSRGRKVRTTLYKYTLEEYHLALSMLEEKIRIEQENMERIGKIIDAASTVIDVATVPSGEALGMIAGRKALFSSLLKAMKSGMLRGWTFRGAKEAAKGGLPNSGPIVRSLGAASKAEMLAKKFKMNINSPTTRQVLNSLDETVESFISTYRKSSIRSEIPGEFLNQSVEQALRSGNTTIRKLLTDGRFIK